MRRVLVACAVALMCVFEAARVDGTTIQFTATNLAANRWQYDYFPGDRTFLADQGFAVLFELGLYSDLAVEGPPPPNWDPLAVDPDPNLLSNGFYDALALVSDPSLAGPFRVSFLWLGLGAPQSQPFEIYQLEGAFPRLIEFGQTVPVGTAVPEPSTLLLTAGGAFVGGIVRRRRRTRPADPPGSAGSPPM